MPTRSEVENWDTEHLDAAADHWSKTATVWEDCFTQYAHQVANPGGTPWEGDAAEAAQQRAHSDRLIVVGLADKLHDASAIARKGATQLKEACRLVMRSVHSAEDDGFTVGEDFSVTDGRQFSRVAAAARQAKAEAHADAIRAAVADLVAADTRIAGEITTAAAGLGEDHFAEPDGASQVPGGDQKAVTDALLGNMAGRDKAAAEKLGRGTAAPSPLERLRENMISGRQPAVALSADTILGDLASHPGPAAAYPKDPFSWEPSPTDVVTGVAGGIAGTSHDAALKAAAKVSNPEDAVVRWTKELEVKGVEIPGLAKSGGLMSLATLPMGLVTDFAEARDGGATKLAAAGQAVTREGVANATGLVVGSGIGGLAEAGAVAGGTWLATTMGAAETGALVGSVIPGAGTAVGLAAGLVIGGAAAFLASKGVAKIWDVFG